MKRTIKTLIAAGLILSCAAYSVAAAGPRNQEAPIHFEPTIESLKQYVVPEWFRDAKLGIFMHWGPQCIPGTPDDCWYARYMYEQGSVAYQYHVAHFGHPSKVGYKDVVKLFQPAKFDAAQPDRLVKLYKQAGAGYVVPVAVHHDNFDMWDSKYQPRFNSVAVCGKDVVGMWRKATVANGLHFGVASHVARSYRWMQVSHGSDKTGPLKGVPYDGADPAYQDLYGVPWNDMSFWYERRGDVAPASWIKNFEDRMLDLLDKYHPDLYYTDGGLPFEKAGLNIVSHLYNENQKWNHGQLDAVATIKLDWQPNIAVFNYEFGYTGEIREYPWQSDKSINDEWYWVRNDTKHYKQPDLILHTLIDVASKNGNLLLNVPLTPDGTLEQESVDILTKLGHCLQIMGEALFKTRPWVCFGEGPSGFGMSGFSLGTPRDIRFTRNKEDTVLYATAMGWPGDGRPMKIKTLNSSRFDLKTLTGISMLGGPGNVRYRQDAEALYVFMPATKPFESYSYAIKMTFSGPIPELKAGDPPTILAAADGSFALIAEDAALHGMGREVRSNLPTLAYWTSAEAWASWDRVRFTKKGLYDVVVIAAAPSQTSLMIDFGSQKMTAKLPATGGYSNFRELALGRVEIKEPGYMPVIVRPASAETWHAINLAKVILTPQK